MVFENVEGPTKQEFQHFSYAALTRQHHRKRTTPKAGRDGCKNKEEGLYEQKTGPLQQESASQSRDIPKDKGRCKQPQGKQNEKSPVV